MESDSVDIPTKMTGYNHGDNDNGERERQAASSQQPHLCSVVFRRVLGTVVYDVSYFIGTSHLGFYGFMGALELHDKMKQEESV